MPSKPSGRIELQALHNLLSEAESVTRADNMPYDLARRLAEILQSAKALTDDLIGQTTMKPAAVLGHKGGSTTSKRFGTEHYRKMAAARKIRSGGRPRKQP